MKKKVLVVDDEKEIVDFLEKFLRRLDITVMKAVSGGEAVELCKKDSPDCVFLDIQMPDKDGLTVLQEIIDLNAALKVIMITGKEKLEFQEKAKKIGAIDYITKPLDLSDLNEKVKAYLS
ncbi:MAG: response regulator [Candidatus Omnitrophica bacterium]|nr:response regulator [Candidatus Omnitrophota bacterium]